MAVNILPRQEAAADPHCPMPELSVLLLEGAGLTQRILPLRLSLFISFSTFPPITESLARQVII